MKSLIRQVRTFDEDTGEMVNEVTTRGSPNGKGWVIMYTARTLELMKQCTGSTFKVFSYLACGQQFEERGVITTKKAVQDYLGMTKATVLEAFKWLKEHHIISEVNHSGCSEFLVNPDYVTVGRDKNKRKKAWSRSWEGQTVAIIESPSLSVSDPVASVARASRAPRAPRASDRPVRSIEVD